jgi:hypothetical protein
VSREWAVVEARDAHFIDNHPLHRQKPFLSEIRMSQTLRLTKANARKVIVTSGVVQIKSPCGTKPRSGILGYKGKADWVGHDNKLG